MEKKVYYDPESAINSGNKFFESLVKLIYSIENLDYNSWNMKNNVDRLKDYGVYSPSIRNIFNQARETRNLEIHSDELTDSKQSFRLCALLFKCSCWFFNKYSNEKVDCSTFDKDLILDKNFQDNKGVIDEDKIKQIVIDIVQEMFPKGNSSDDKNEVVAVVEEHDDNFYQNIVSKLSLKQKNGSFLLNELSKLNKSSNNSVDGFNGFKNYFEKYMHVNRGIEQDFKEKLFELSEKSNAQLIFLVGSVGDGKSHLLSYMNSEKESKALMEDYFIHGDASESFAHNIDEIRTLEIILEDFNDKNYKKSTFDESKIVAINLGTLSNFIEDDIVKSKFKKLIELIDNVNILSSDVLNYIDTKGFLTIINFSDYQLYELHDGFVSSKFILELLNKITVESEDNPFYWSYKLDLRNNVFNPIIYNYRMLLNSNVKEIIIQNLIKYNIKNKKQISTRNILNFIYEILVPSEIKEYDKSNLHEYIEDMLPVLLFKSNSRSPILEQINHDFSYYSRNELIDEFIVSLNTRSMRDILDQCFDNVQEFSFIKNYLLGENYQLQNKNVKLNVISYLIYFAVFFGNERIKNAFNEGYYSKYLKFLYIYNYRPNDLKELFKYIETAIFRWKGSLNKGYIIVDDLPNFKIAKELDIMYKPVKVKNSSLNIFKKEISFKIFVGDDNYCTEDCDACSKPIRKCVDLNVDYLLFEYIMKMTEGYKPNKNETENLILFDEFISDLISKSKNNQIFIHIKRNSHEFKFKKLPNGEYKLRRV